MRDPSPPPPAAPPPLSEASDAELRKVIDDVLKSNRIYAATGEIVPAQPDPRFHTPERSIAERREGTPPDATGRTEPSVLGGKKAPDEWYVAIGGKTVGPLTLKAVRSFWDDGTLDPDLLCWRDGMAGWKPIHAVEDLVAALGHARVQEQAKLKRGDSSGKWTAVAGDGLEGLRPGGKQGFAPPTVPAPPVDVGAVIRSAIFELTPLLQLQQRNAPAAAPRKSPLVGAAMLGGVISGVCVAGFFWLVRPDVPEFLRGDDSLAGAAAPTTTGLAGVAPGPGTLVGTTGGTTPSAQPISVTPVARPTDVVGSAAPKAMRAAPREGTSLKAAGLAPGRKAGERSAESAPEAPKDDFDRTFTGTEQETAAPVAVDDLPETLEHSDIMGVVLEHKAAADGCLNKFPSADPEGPRTLVMRWTIQTDGQTADITALTDELAGSPLAECLESQIATWRFPKHRNERSPFAFPFRLAQ